MPPQVAPLRHALIDLLSQHGALLLGLNGLRAADRFSQRLHQWRLRRGREGAQALIGRYAALKATGVAANPLLLLDLAGGLALDAARVSNDQWRKKNLLDFTILLTQQIVVKVVVIWFRFGIAWSRRHRLRLWA